MSRIEIDPTADGAPGLSTPRIFPRVRVWTLALLAGLIAGFISWLVGEAIHGRYAPPKLVLTAAPTGGFVSGPEIQKRTMAKRSAQTLEATLAFGSLGAFLGLALGLAGGIVRGSAQTAVSASLAGTIFGGAAGAASTNVILPIFFRILDPDSNDLIVGTMVQFVISSAIGAVGGLAFGIGLGDRSRFVRAIVGGLVGAIAGGLVYEMAGAIEFPLDNTSDPISATWGTRLLARLAVTTLASAGAAMGALDQGKRPTPYFDNPEHRSS